MDNKYHLPFTAVVPESNEEDTRLQPIIFLHGYGSNMISRADVASFIDNPEFVYFFVNAPTRISIDSKLPSFRWYEYQNEDYQPELKESTEKLLNTIDYICFEYGLKEEDIIISGFSQGGILAIDVALNTDRVYKAVAAFSSRLESEPEIDRPKIEFFVAQGISDPIFPPNVGGYARDVLMAAGHSVSYHEYEMGHEISEECFADFAQWIANL